MGLYTRIILIVLIILIGGGLVFLVTWDIPPPSGQIEKIVPDSRLEK